MIDKIIDLYQVKPFIPIKEICDKLGINHSSMYVILKRNNIELRKNYTSNHGNKEQIIDSKKFCPDCGDYRRLCEFGDSKSRKNKKAVYCKKHCNKRKKVYRMKYPERITASRKEYLKLHRDKYNQYHRQIQRDRRARQKNAFIERVIDKKIYLRDGWICQICHRKVNNKLKYPHPMSASIDHIIPLALEGKHEPKNCQLAHLICNERKHTKGANVQLRVF